ncbi:replication protein RepL [Dysgonomonas alginatilytica]|uniref:Replication protein RepL n=1 Tax=Dysgonomonas alginatilytica TaxID=1605892 RepID=A0A2V3PNU6_9BACT|nr:replication/maintenance protein RepL [Dysgonomonas alginatilytica]PXV62355.1 replication protein RepL [Dysgonomonas alginatilytica]
MGKLNATNPFIETIYDLKTKMRTSVYARGDMVSLVDESTGEVKGNGFNAIVRDKQYDSERFVKLYANGREVLPKLSVSATKVLWFLIDGMGYDDVVRLNLSKAKKVTGYKSDAVIYRAITELKGHNVLANAYSCGLYFINPTMLYRGNRLKLISD